jgi:hypothetical protein
MVIGILTVRFQFLANRATVFVNVVSQGLAESDPAPYLSTIQTLEELVSSLLMPNIPMRIHLQVVGGHSEHDD